MDSNGIGGEGARRFEIMQLDKGEVLAYEVFTNGSKAMYPYGLGIFADYGNSYVKAEILRALKLIVEA